MKIALLGYGKMGQEIEKIAIDRGHEIVSKIDVSSKDSFTDQGFKAKIVMLGHKCIPFRTLGYVGWAYYEMVDG